jgi:tripartite-type tricarboxylate transporter receptor subunit TctC
MLRSIVAALLAIAAGTAAAEEPAAFPGRPIRMIVPFPAGGPSDIVARVIGQKMSEDWGQPVVIENRPGANTIIGAQAAAKAAPDGYTLFMAIDSTLVMNQYLYKNLPYDPINDFVPITPTAKTVSALAVAANGPKSVKDLIASAKAQPGKLSYGAGTITAQLMGHLFHKAAGIDILYVPFKGTPETVNGLLTGSVELIYAAGLVAPRGTPPAIIDKINAEVVKALTDPAVKEKSERTGNYPVTSSPEAFAAFIRKEAQRWSKVIQETGIKFD